jgi:hypothetical protein
MIIGGFDLVPVERELNRRMPRQVLRDLWMHDVKK